MSVLDRMAALLGYSKAQQGVLYPAWLTASADAERYTLIDEGRRAAPEQVYRKLSWVHIAVTRLAQTGAVAGFEVSRRCLLYTSPSPRDRTRSRMPSSA